VPAADMASSAAENLRLQPLRRLPMNDTVCVFRPHSLGVGRHSGDRQRQDRRGHRRPEPFLPTSQSRESTAWSTTRHRLKLNVVAGEQVLPAPTTRAGSTASKASTRRSRVRSPAQSTYTVLDEARTGARRRPRCARARTRHGQRLGGGARQANRTRQKTGEFVGNRPPSCSLTCPSV
jgi:hypothetical protein